MIASLLCPDECCPAYVWPILETHIQDHTNKHAQNEQPNVIANAATWGLHMGLSANTRYQLLGGLDSVSEAVSSELGVVRSVGCLY